MTNKIKFDAVLHLEDRFLFLMLVQTLALEYSRIYDRSASIATTVLAECMHIPADLLPMTIEGLHRWASEYIEYSYKRDVAKPEWFQDEWMG